MLFGTTPADVPFPIVGRRIARSAQQLADGRFRRRLGISTGRAPRGHLRHWLLGAVLLATRVCDALLDPWIGRWIDARFARGALAVWQPAAWAALLMALGFAALWQPLRTDAGAVVMNLALASVLTFVAYSVVSVTHQAWGARWGGDEGARARIVAWREGAALVGVVMAGALPAWAGPSALPWALALTLALGVALLRTTASQERPSPSTTLQAPARTTYSPSPSPSPSPWASPAFRRLLAVFMLNGVASAIPATLLPFFVADRLQLPGQTATCLMVYFLAAGLGLSVWVRAIRRWGLVPCWLTGMGLSIAAFIGVLALGAGDLHAFLLICATSGLALGVDLVAPAALLAGIVPRQGEHGQDGGYFGWWACANKLNAALAVGLALPMLSALGYAEGSRDADALWALTLAYGAWPCAFKLAAAVCLWRSRHHLTA